MKKKFTLITIIAALSFLAFAAYAEKPLRVENEVLYKLKEDATPAQIGQLNRILAELGMKPGRGVPKLKLLRGKANNPKGYTEEEMCQMLMESDAVKYAEPNILCPAAYVPDDADLSLQWQHERINTFGAWAASQGEGITIGICDTGCDLDHPDLVDHFFDDDGDGFIDGSNMTDEASSYTGDDGLEDVQGHGTFVAGMAAAVGNNGIGAAGSAYKSRIMPIAITPKTDNPATSWDERKTASFIDMASAIIYAVDNGCKVVNLSYSVSTGYGIFDAAAYCIQNDALLFVAAGNSGDYMADGKFSGQRADTNTIIYVSGTRSTDASYGNYGPFTDIAAPAVGVYSTKKGGGYGTGTGTSYATPLAAGVAAQIWALDPSLSNEAVKSILFTTAEDIGDPGEDDRFGVGIVDAGAAIAQVISDLGIINDPPVATNQSVSVNEDGSVAITLTGSDPDEDSITFGIRPSDQPTSGTLTGTAPNLTYTPNPDFFGSDSFTFTATDDYVDSAPATISITVNPIQDAPTASNGALNALSEFSTRFMLSGSDADNDSISYAIVDSPAHGTLKGTAPNLFYLSDYGYTGNDQLSFTVSDGSSVSSTATVSIVVGASTMGEFNIYATESFENGYGIFSNAANGSQIVNNSTYAGDGVNSLELSNSESTDLTVPIDGTYASQIKVDFSYYARKMETNDSFSVKYWDGDSWELAHQYICATDFMIDGNGTITSNQPASVTINGTFTDDFNIRFVCDTGEGKDFFYIDDVVIYVNPVMEDGDSDGMADSWENTYFPAIGASDGTGDSDGDGTKDFFEYIYGSNPTNAASSGFGLNAQMDGTGIACDWSVRDIFVLGQDYGAAISSNLASWVTLPSGQYNLTATTNNGMTKLEVILPEEFGPNAFFKFTKP